MRVLRFSYGLRVPQSSNSWANLRFCSFPPGTRSDGGAISEAVIESLPLFLHNFGSSGLPVCDELIGNAVNVNSRDVFERLARISGILVCCVGHKTQLKRQRDRELLVTHSFILGGGGGGIAQR